MNREMINHIVIRTERDDKFPGKHDAYQYHGEKWEKLETTTGLENSYIYGEFNTLYWIWKNVNSNKIFFFSDGIYPGSSKKDFSEEDLLQMTNKEEICLFNKQHFNGNFGDEIRKHIFFYKDLGEIAKYVKSKGKLVKAAYDKVMISDSAYASLSFAVEKEEFDKLMSFVFECFDYMADKIDVTKYPKKCINVFETIGILLVNIYINIYMKRKDVPEVCMNKINVDADSNEITYYFDENEVVIVLSSSDYFSPYLGVCIQSIVQNVSSKYYYDIIVCEREISNLNKEKIYGICKQYSNVSVRFLNVRQQVKAYNFYVNSTRISQETYYGLLLPWILKNFKKALIMDCDMIAKKDLAELFYTDLGDFIGAGVRDVILQGWLNDEHNDTATYYKNEVKAKDPFTYVNGGLILLDFEKYKRCVSIDSVMDLINHRAFRVVDQDIFNYLLEGKMKALDPKWNHMVLIQGAISEAIDNAPMAAQESYFKAKKDPGIIHYASENKPWLNPTLEFAPDFWECARITPFYEEIIFRMVSNNGMPSRNNALAIPEHRTFPRKVADFFLPKGTKRREFLKKIIPKGSRRWAVLKQVFYVFSPRYRRPMSIDIVKK